MSRFMIIFLYKYININITLIERQYANSTKVFKTIKMV